MLLLPVVVMAACRCLLSHLLSHFQPLAAHSQAHPVLFPRLAPSWSSPSFSSLRGAFSVLM
jgi:hypothetical protein